MTCSTSPASLRKAFRCTLDNERISGLGYALEIVHDTCILDIMLPNMDGFDLLKKLHLRQVHRLHKVLCMRTSTQQIGIKPSTHSFKQI